MAQHSAESLPIDIHYNKLLDWLISRRHCSKEWQGATVAIREKINSAIQDMPEVEEISALLEGTYINYFHCLTILGLLKETESGKKNIFGQYSSQRMKDWAEIVKLFEKDGVYLGEVAQMISRNVNYEIPALKKQIAKCQQIQKDCTRKEADYSSNQSELRRKYDASCKQMGIEGKKIKSELAALVRDLPTEYQKMAKTTKSLQSAVDYYLNFVSYVMKSNKFESESLQFLKFVVSHGDVTTYQWRTGSAPDRVEDTNIQIDTTDEQEVVEEAGDIDWGGEEEQIDFGDDINLDITDITVESGGAETELKGDDDNGIDYGDLVDEGAKDATVDTAGDGVARGKDALSVLDNPDTRNEFINDLLELEAFLTQRLSDMGSEEDVLAGSQFQSAPSAIQIDASKVKDMLNNVKAILEKLTSVQMQHLLLIRNSPRYVERLKDSLKQTLTLADKMVFYEKEMVVKRKEALEEQGQLEPKLDVLISKTKVMQKQMEGEISKKYKDRSVNIMGEINTI
ncbi:CDK5 regulatory subunit-associated protein 3-like [Haliotis rubra]|uniref:CDK5 regulatory subunit-associated protein 3-like n=1 Tax=Haliotis rubra TaxID=36100 RepID=UPI001EE53E71|nr:CDK5 regulatory subunit-associated protein 3-like [Haliotis rubra]XP_046568067.1 CDK5 regulatory subunit-associated protein 3-like [Haliotis rubra]